MDMVRNMREINFEIRSNKNKEIYSELIDEGIIGEDK